MDGRTINGFLFIIVDIVSTNPLGMQPALMLRVAKQIAQFDRKLRRVLDGTGAGFETVRLN